MKSFKQKLAAIILSFTLLFGQGTSFVFAEVDIPTPPPMLPPRSVSRL
jgi:hypothetical protein